MTSLVEKAENLAFYALDTETFKHSLRIKEGCGTEEEMVVALLHDVLEDNITLNQEYLYRNHYPEKVIRAVDILTRRKNQNYLSEYINNIKSNELARKIKILDLEDNLYGRETLPKDSLRKRYLKALEILRREK